jgi:hypothetical protein
VERLGLNTRGGEFSCSLRSGGLGVRVSARPDILVQCVLCARGLEDVQDPMLIQWGVGASKRHTVTSENPYWLQSIAKSASSLQIAFIFSGPTAKALV